MGDGAGAAYAVLDVFPSFGNSVAHGGQGTKASHNYSFEFHSD